MTFEAGWNAAIEKAAEVIGELEARFHELTNEALSLKQDNRASRCGSVAHEMNRALRAIRSLTLPSDLVAVPREPTPEEMKEVAKAIGNTLASMHGGCFNPTDDPNGECADGDCYCSRMCDRTASAAISSYRAMLAAHKEGQ